MQYPLGRMELRFTPEQDAFRAEVRAWLETNVPSPSLRSMDTADGFEAHRAWERTLFDGGWGVVSWPKEYGGRGLSLLEWLIFEEEYYRADAPGRVNQNGLFLLGPTLMDYGTPEQKSRFLPAMAAGEEIWCQGWSEPNAGSDMANIRCKAVREGDEWVIEGQKTWCSRGVWADWLFGLFRSEPGSERNKGLTMVLMPMDTPGVDARPIAQMDGETGFAEVFFDGARVPVANTLGGEGEGWNVAMTTAGFERGLLLRPPGRFLATARRLHELFVKAGEPESYRDAVARAQMQVRMYRLYVWWTAGRLARGEKIGPESSVNKLVWSTMDMRMHETAIDLMGLAGITDEGSASRWIDGYYFSLAGPIYAGTNEIQRNIIGERVLGLPR
jgi:alkylation response protein AidB-like acyl-CoA dehydrogenase